MRVLFLSFILILLSVCVVSAANYGDLEIFVSQDGSITIEGLTNTDLITENNPNYTSKDGRYWMLNISPEGVFSNLIYKLHLPEGADINYLKTPTLSRIEHNSNDITIIGTAQNQYLELIVQYQIQTGSDKNAFWWVIPLIIILVVSPLVFLLIKRKPKKKINTSSLTERQKKIISLLVKNKGSMTQKQLEDYTGLAKSSLSRNIDSLVKKNLIKKENKGMTNLISLNKD